MGLSRAVKMIRHRDLLILITVFAALAVVPLFLGGNLSVMNLLITCLIWAVVAAAWDLIMGFAGIFTFGQVAFFVIGAYTSAILTTRYGLSPWLGLPIGGLFTAVIGVLVALPCLRLKGAYVALMTFGVHMILAPFLNSDLGRAIGTGGTQGMIGIPPLSLGDYQFSTLHLVPWFYSALVLALIALLVIYRIIHSPWGLAFVAVRDSEVLASSLGVNEFQYKLMVFGLSAFLTGVMGAFYAHYVGVLSTRILGLDLFLILLVIIVLGGMGRFPGAVIGAFATVFLSELLRPLGVYRPVIFGAAVVFLVLFVPQGAIGLLLSKRWPWHRLTRRAAHD